jgi:hypothetical protein
VIEGVDGRRCGSEHKVCLGEKITTSRLQASEQAGDWQVKIHRTTMKRPPGTFRHKNTKAPHDDQRRYSRRKRQGYLQQLSISYRAQWNGFSFFMPDSSFIPQTPPWMVLVLESCALELDLWVSVMVYSLSVSKARDPLIAIIVSAAIGILTTALRLKARRMRQIALGIDDWLMLAALVC